MKLLYVASSLLATAAIANSQVVAFIIFAFELIEAQTGLTLLFDFESSIEITSELFGEEMTFIPSTNWVHVLEWEGEDAVDEFGTDLFIDHIDPVPANAVDEPFFADLEWNHHLQAFGRIIPVDLSATITTDVTVDEFGDVA